MLTVPELHRATRTLARLDPDLARVVRAHGPPPLWQRRPGFGTLVHIILEQQVSLASARAAFHRARALAHPFTPANVLQLDDRKLRVAGFSRQKTQYCRNLARAILDRELELGKLAYLDDDEVRRQLTAVKGIGDWTADIYLIMVLGRPDIWPLGDIALAQAARELKRLSARPSSAEMTSIGESWRPWRAVAARVLWHHYLSTPRRRGSERPQRKFGSEPIIPR
jgi:DNA-3-methyladenine glycosylase II